MSEYHVSCGLQYIYAGKLNKAKTDWTEKSEVTQEAYAAVFQHIKEDMETHKELGRTYKFNFRGDVVLEVKATIMKPKKVINDAEVH